MHESMKIEKKPKVLTVESTLDKLDSELPNLNKSYGKCDHIESPRSGFEVPTEKAAADFHDCLAKPCCRSKVSSTLHNELVAKV